MIRFSIIFVFSLFTSGLLGNNDSLIRFADLQIKNTDEKNALKSFQELGVKADIIDLFISHYTHQENFSSRKIHEQIMACVSDLKEETRSQDEAKRVKTIYREVHKRFLKVYKLTNSFSNIFENGEYNCVSGSALYAIIFQFMNIPYQIVEAPQHVFLFAYPNSHKIAIETTMPQKGYFTFTDSYVEKFVKHFYENKLISQQEYESNSTNQLFEKYYFENKGLSIQGLAAIQYANYAAYNLNDNENHKALEEIKKAYYIHPSARNKYMLQSTLWYCITNRSYKEKGDVNNLAILCRTNNADNKEVSNEKIKYEFSRLTDEQLISNSNFELYTASFHSIYNCISDSTLQRDIAFYYHYEMARLGYTNDQAVGEQLKHLKAAYLAKPKHADLRNMIKSYLGKLIDKEGNMTAALKSLEDYSSSFDFLNEDGPFNSVKANCILEMAYQSFTMNEISKGEKHLNNFEALCKKNELVKPQERFVERAYSSAATCYYKKGNRSKTQYYLKTGLIYAPQNFGLKMRLNQAR